MGISTVAKLFPTVIVILVGALSFTFFGHPGPLADDPGGDQSVDAPSACGGDRAFALIFRLAARFARGELQEDELKANLSCDARLACEAVQIRDELAVLRTFLGRDRRCALASAIEHSRRCIAQGHIYTEVLDTSCEGALFSLGFFESEQDDRVILEAFEKFLDADLSVDGRASLANAFYPRFNGLVWFADRPDAAAWTDYLRAVSAQFGLFTPEQLAVVLGALNDPPANLSFQDFSFPAFSAQRRLRALTRGVD